MKTRAQRRHDEKRVVAKRLREHKSWPIEQAKCVFKTTGKPCSCDICCNVRRSPWTKANKKLTMQERRLMEAIKEDKI